MHTLYELFNCKSKKLRSTSIELQNQRSNINRGLLNQIYQKKKWKPIWKWPFSQKGRSQKLNSHKVTSYHIASPKSNIGAMRHRDSDGVVRRWSENHRGQETMGRGWRGIVAKAKAPPETRLPRRADGTGGKPRYAGYFCQQMQCDFRRHSDYDVLTVDEAMTSCQSWTLDFILFWMNAACLHPKHFALYS